MELWHQITLGAVLFLLVVVHFWVIARILSGITATYRHVNQVLNNTVSHNYVRDRLSSIIDLIAVTRKATEDKVWAISHETDRILLELEKLGPFDTDIAASILEAHFRKKKDEEGLMLVNSIRPLLQRKVPRKKKQTDIDTNANYGLEA